MTDAPVQVEVFKCIIPASNSGEIPIVDLVFVDGMPYAVFSWTVEPDTERRFPEYAEQLDSARLKLAPPKYRNLATHFYELPLRIPDIPGSRVPAPRG